MEGAIVQGARFKDASKTDDKRAQAEDFNLGL